MTRVYAPERVRLLRQHSVINGVFIEQPVSLEQTESWCDAILKSQVRSDFVFLYEGVVIGFAGLVNISYKNGLAEFYIFISDEEQGKGYGKLLTKWVLSFAKQELGLRKVTLFVTQGNENAVKLYKNIGFNLEGTLKKHSWFRGSYVDRFIMSVFLDEIDNDLDVYSFFS